MIGGIRCPVIYSFKNKKQSITELLLWSGLRGSNPPPPPWQGGALPNELNPRKWCLRSESNQRHEDFQSSALPTELQRHTRWRLGWGSNPRPLAWQARALTNWATKPFLYTFKRGKSLLWEKYRTLKTFPISFLVESIGLDSRANYALGHSRIWQSFRLSFNTAPTSSNLCEHRFLFIHWWKV